MKKRFICILLVLLLLVSVLPFCITDAAAYYDTGYATSDYTTWKQTSTQWASASPWAGTSSKFGDVGCYITSVAILLAKELLQGYIFLITCILGRQPSCSEGQDWIPLHAGK